MSIKVRKLSFALGAEITGVDLSKELGNGLMAEINNAWLEHSLLVFPGQDLSPKEQAAFGRQFGQLDSNLAARDYLHPDCPEVYMITNHKINGQLSDTRDAGRLWHSDHSFTTRPTLATMLYCLERPEVGGNTLFANMYMAYESLSATMKKTLEKLEAVHSFASFVGKNPHMHTRNTQHTAEHEKKNPPVAHPIVRVHPESGRKALFVSEGYTSHIAGMTMDESKGILDYLYTHSVKPEFTYRHAWGIKDLLMWDNRCVMHLAPADYTHDEPRHMHRVTVSGTPLGRVYSPSV